jgi:predicted acylesterase/phospholipase RssA
LNRFKNKCMYYLEMRGLLSTLFSIVSILITPVAAIESCNVLALSGGGSFGAVEMGVLDAISSDGRAPRSYDIITGISAGGLNTGFLSYYKDVQTALPEIKNIYSTIRTADVYTRDILGILSEWSLYNTKALETTLTTILESKTPLEDGPLSLIGSTNTNTSDLDVFMFHWNATLSRKVEILMATSAIPLVFPPRIVDSIIYVDGGVISNELLTQALGQLPCVWYNLTFVSASRKSGANVQVSGFFSYVDAVLHTLLHSFDSQLARLTNCSYPRGTIRACYPTSPELEQYSILDFDNGEILYELGKESNKCEDFPLCI